MDVRAEQEKQQSKAEDKQQPAWKHYLRKWGFSSIHYAIAIGLVVLYGLFYLKRSYTQDEGFYLLFAQYVLDGWMPYRDFFYPHTPYFPYLLAAWLKLTDASLASARMLSLIATLASCLLLWGIARKEDARPWYAISAPLLLLLSFPFLEWDSIVKPFALSTLCLVAAYAMFLRFLAAKNRPIYLLWAGLLILFSVQLRLNLLPFALLGMGLSYFMATNKKQALAHYTLGALAVSLPALLFLAFLNEQVWFDTFTFHSLRGGIYGATKLSHRLQAVIQYFGGHSGQIVPTMIFAAALCVTLFKWKELSPPPSFKTFGMPLLFAFTAIFCAMLPKPPRVEYFVTAAPFLALFSLQLIRLHVTVSLMTIVAAAGLFGFTYWPLINSFTSPSAAPHYIENVRQVAKVIQEHTSNNDRIFAWWAGYAVEADRRMIRGSEIGTAVRELSGRITREQSKKYHVFTEREVIDLIRARQAKVVVSGIGAPKGFDKFVKIHYPTFIESVGATVYVRDE